MKSPLISVIVPIYNVEQYLNKCIECIVGQSYKNLEIILVDDGSPDKCPQMCDEWGRKDERIKVIHKSNGGLSDARNVGVKHASGDYVLFVDSDDWIDNKIKNVVSSIDYEYDIIAVGIRCINNNKQTTIEAEEFEYKDFGNLQKIKYFKRNRITNAVCHIFNRQFLIDNNLEFEKGIYYEDLEFMSRALLKATSICSKNIVFYNYVVLRNGSITTNMKFKNFQDRLYVCNKINETAKQITNKKLYKIYKQNYSMYFYEIVFGFNYVKIKNPECVKLLKENKYLLKFPRGIKNNLARILISICGIKLFQSLIISLYKLKHKRDKE